MNTTLVLQSFRDRDVPAWMMRCMQSVRDWTALHGYGYRFEGDELLQRVPDWYRHKAGTRLPIVADLGRLLWMREILQTQQVERVVWLDADLYVFAPEQLTVALSSSCLFGREYWVQQQGGRWRIHRNVHNAYCVFTRGCTVLPFLIETVQRLVERVDAQRMPPQFVGPKLLTSLHNIAQFELEPRVGALSPPLQRELIDGPGEALRRLSQALPQPLLAANLCASLQHGDEDMDALLDVLDGFRNGLR